MHLVLDQSDRKTVMLVPDEMILASQTELTQYFIKDWSLTFMNPGNLLDASIQADPSFLKMQLMMAFT